MAALITFCLMFIFLPLAKQLAAPDALTVVIHTIEQLIDFYQNDYMNLNVDGLFGLRVLEGHLMAIVEEHKLGHLGHLSPETVARLISLKGKASNICEAAVKDVEKDNPAYYRSMQFVVGSPWSVFEERRRRVNMINAWSPVTYRHAKETVDLNESLSDECMAELIGSHRAGGLPCDISDKCAHIMTTPGLLGYGITHQLLWTMLAEKAGCKKHLMKKLTATKRGSLDSLLEELCSNNYIQMVQTIDRSTKSVIMPSLQDIFLEQLLICPSLGFFEFLKLEYLPAIVSWQLKSGCYGKMPHPGKAKDINDESLVGKFKDDYTDDGAMEIKASKDVLKDILAGVKIGDNVQKKAGNYGNRMLLSYEASDSYRIGRKLLVEKVMTGGCLAHKTAVASGALAIYLRYLTESDADQLFNVSSHADLEHKTRLGGPSDLGKPAKILDTLVAKAVGENKQVTQDHHGDGIQELHDNLMRNEADLNKLPDAGETRLDTRNQKFKVLPSQQTGLKNGNFKSNPKKNVEEHGMDAVDNNVLADQMHETKRGVEDYNEDYQLKVGDEKRMGRSQLNNQEYHAEHHQLVKPLMKNVDEQYDNEDDNDEDDYAYEDEDDDDEDEYDDVEEQGQDYKHNADYVYEKDDQDLKNGHEMGQGHLIVRNLGRPGVKQYENNVFDDKDEKSLGLGPEKDYKYDEEEEEDDYEYDDDNDEMERRRKEEVKQNFQKPNIATFREHPARLTAEQTSSGTAVSQTMVFFVVVLSLCSLLLFYRFVRKRRLRIRINSKYFHI